jgi:hypothetical protein
MTARAALASCACQAASARARADSVIIGSAATPTVRAEWTAVARPVPGLTQRSRGGDPHQGHAAVIHAARVGPPAASRAARYSGVGGVPSRLEEALKRG